MWRYIFKNPILLQTTSAADSIIDKFEWWQLLIGIGVIGSIAIFTIFLILNFISRKKDNLKMNIFGLKISKDKKEEEEKDKKSNITINVDMDKDDGLIEVKGENDEKISIQPSGKSMAQMDASALRPEQCKKCLLALYGIPRTVALSKEIITIKFYRCLDDQMSVAEKKLDHIKNILVNKYIDLLHESKDCTNVMLDSSFIIFHNLLKNLLQWGFVNMFKRSFKEDHLCGYVTKEEYIREYVSERTPEIFEDFKVQLNLIIPDFIRPGVKDIKRILNNVKREIIDIFNDIYVDAYKIAKKYSAKITKMIETYNNDVLLAVGKKNIVTLDDFDIH